MAGTVSEEIPASIERVKSHLIEELGRLSKYSLSSIRQVVQRVVPPEMQGNRACMEELAACTRKFVESRNGNGRGVAVGSVPSGESRTLILSRRKGGEGFEFSPEKNGKGKEGVEKEGDQIDANDVLPFMRRFTGSDVLFSREYADHSPSFPLILSLSPSMKNVEDFLRRNAPVEGVEILIIGESGTGKELVARAIHQLSPRRRGPFVAINCAALPNELVENELFGHKKGAYTGAQDAEKGKIQLADGGTLFLDEVTEMPPLAQAKLLRFLEEREYDRVGGGRVRVNVRVLAATNCDPRQAVAAGKLRTDILYRLNVPLRLPSLRERKEDIIPFAYHYLDQYATGRGEASPLVSVETAKSLLSYEWPGNVRQLKVSCNAVVCAGVELPTPADFQVVPVAVQNGVDGQIFSFREAQERWRYSYLVEVLSRAKGDVGRAAKMAQKDRAEFYRLVRRYGIDLAMFRLSPVND